MFRIMFYNGFESACLKKQRKGKSSRMKKGGENLE